MDGYPDFLHLPGEGYATLLAHCIGCGTLVTGDPDTMTSVRVHPETLCPLRPDGTQLQPGDPDGIRAPFCVSCAATVTANHGRPAPVHELFRFARLDRITPRR